MDNIIYGRNSVIEALNSENTEIDTIYTSAKGEDKLFYKLKNLAKAKNAPLKQVDAKKLAMLCESDNHQGVVASICQVSYASIDDIFDKSEALGEKPFIVICDGIEDPHNLGAIIRTAECAGAHGVVIGQRRSCQVTGTVVKASAGAVNHMEIARVVNIPDTIEKIKARGVFVYGADMDGENIYKTDLSGSIALVVGSEGKGMSRLVHDKCDVIISLPMKGKINSLNASVAGGIAMYEILKTRCS